VGVVFIYGSQLLLAGAGRVLGAGVENLLFHQTLFLGFTLFSFFLGGFVVGLYSPGRTIVAPPLAALGAAVLDAALPPSTAAQMAAGSWPFIVMTGFLLALFGGWMGERLPTPTDTPAPLVLFWSALLLVALGVPAAMLALGIPTWAAAVLLATAGGAAYWGLARQVGGAGTLGRS
jgi:hypothetical protein